MSKSYGKHKTVGICVGSNTEFYRERRKHQRRVNKNRMRNVMANKDADEFDDNYIPYDIVKKDDWEEPTDGTIKFDAKRINNLKQNANRNFGLYVDKNGNVKK